jgi:ligand-binding sensor domain-containing protein
MKFHGVWQIILRVLVVLVVSSILFSLRFTIPVHAKTSTIRFENISTEQGLSQSTVNAILQDRQGFLRFTTEGGLNQYDGYQFTVYQHDTDNPRSLSANLFFTFFEDQDGILWIGTEQGWLNLWDNQDNHFKIYRHEPGNPSSLTQDRLPGGQFMPC